MWNRLWSNSAAVSRNPPWRAGLADRHANVFAEVLPRRAPVVFVRYTDADEWDDGTDGSALVGMQNALGLRIATAALALPTMMRVQLPRSTWSGVVAVSPGRPPERITVVRPGFQHGEFGPLHVHERL